MQTVTVTTPKPMLADQVVLGFSDHVAAQIMPINSGDPTIPQIDARTLWERIGKPYGQFRCWAEYYIKPRLPNAEIIPSQVGGHRGRPRIEYRLSPRLAALLATQSQPHRRIREVANQQRWSPERLGASSAPVEPLSPHQRPPEPVPGP